VLDVREDRNWVEFFGLTSNTAAVVTRARECAPLLPRQPIDQPLTYGSVPISKSSTTSSPTEDSIADQDAIEA
jgi:hypothetical protein